MRSTFTIRTLAIAGALALAVASPLAAQAAQPAARTITFEEAIGLALRQNVAVKQAENATASDAATVRQQKLAFLPSLSLSANTAQNLGRNFSETEGAVVNQTAQSLNAGLSSSLTLFDGLKNVAGLRAAQSQQDAGERDLARARQTAVFTVASNFLSLVAQQEQLRVQTDNLAAQEAQLAQIQRYVDAGARPISDLYSQQAAVAAAKASLVDAKRSLELAKVDLIGTLQLDPSGSYDFAAPAVGDTAAAAPAYDLDSLLARAWRTRADLDAQESRVDAAKQGVKQAAAGLWPTISLSAGYNTAYNSATDLAFSDQLNQRRGGSVGIGVSIPLFDRGATQAAAERAKVQEDDARLALANQRQQVALEVRRAWLDEQAARERLNAAAAQQKAAQQALDASQQRYTAGAATLVELSQARAALTTAQSALVNARYTLVFQRSLMSYYTGDLDPAKLTLAD